MTENEAKFLEKLDELANDLEVDMYSVANLNFFFEESANTIRKLIEEVQQYRAIGTVEGYERAIASSIENYNLYREYKSKVQEFEAIGTIEDFKALKEKDIPIIHGKAELELHDKGIRNKAIDEFAERLKAVSIRGCFEYKPDKKNPWQKVRSYCRVVGTRKIDEIAEQLKGGAE